MARTVDHGLIFEGDVKIRNRNIPGAGAIDVGNTTSLSTAVSTETQDRKSKRKNTYGQALDSLKTINPTELKLDLDTFDAHNLAMALMGSSAVIAATAQTVTDEEIVIGELGQLYKLKHGNIDPASVKVKGKSDAAVANDQLEINDNIGMIGAIEGAAGISKGDTIKVSYKTRASGGYTISAGALSRLDLEIWVDGKNRVTGEPGVLHIPHAVLAADGEIDWFGDDFNTASFAGTAVLADGETSSYSFTSYAA